MIADGFFLHLLLAASLSLQGADLSMTMYRIGQGTVTESNPIATPFVHQPALAGATKMAIAGGFAWAMLHDHERHPTRALLLSIAIDSLYTWVIVHNAQQDRLIGRR